jgi:hypothetical protein
MIRTDKMEAVLRQPRQADLRRQRTAQEAFNDLEYLTSIGNEIQRCYGIILE